MVYLLFPFMIFVLSFISGMFGLGVAFISTPILGLFGFDLKQVIMPWSLLLNGLTAISSAVAFTHSKMVDWRTAVPLLAITTLVAPLGVWILRFVPTNIVWWIFVGVLLFLAYRMSFAPQQNDAQETEITDRARVRGGLLSVAIGAFAGFLGVGPGFLMMPTLIMLGYTARIAAATNSVIITLPSFSAFIAHMADARFDWMLVGMTSITAIVGAYYGGLFTVKHVKSRALTRIFAIALVLLAIQRIIVLLSA
jgi:uncharacterized membrane protein YfcA